LFFFSSRRRHTRSYGDWSSDVCSSDLRKSDKSRDGGRKQIADRLIKSGFAELSKNKMDKQRGILTQVGPVVAQSVLDFFASSARSEEHTSELQSPYDLVCRLLLEKKKK